MSTFEAGEQVQDGSCRVLRAQQGEFEVIQLCTPSAAVAVVPELGAKIVTLYDGLRQREWTWSPDTDRHLHRNHVGDAFDVSPLIGVDECIPTVAPCTVDGVELPDHGEAWPRAWRLDEDALADGCIATELRLLTLPLSIRREVRLVGATLRLDYRLQNLASRAVPYAWAFHPLWAMRRGDRILLPGGAHRARIDSASGIEGLHAQGQCDWPEPKPGVRVDELALGADLAALKLYLPTPEPAEFAVVNALDGTGLRGRYGPADVLPYLGVWVTRGGWNGFHHFAIEPTNVNADRLAAKPAPAGLMDPGGERRWFLELTFGV